VSVVKWVHFLTLTDSEEIGHCSTYDHNLVYASLLRQLLSLLFSFSVFMYGTLMFLPFAQALFVSILVALTLFCIDQAIIGSEWGLHFDFFRQSWLNYWLNIVYLPLRLLPRILFSLAIAYVIATLAEISLQHKAIDEVLQREMRGLNSEYFSRLAEKEKDLHESIASQQQGVDVLADKIRDKQALFASFRVDMSSHDAGSIAQLVARSAGDLRAKKEVFSSNENKRRLLQAKLVEKKALLQHWENEKVLEVSPGRGAKKGRRWRNANQKTIVLGLDIGQLNAQIVKLDSYHDLYATQLSHLDQQSDKIRAFQLSVAGESLQDLRLKKLQAEDKHLISQGLVKDKLDAFKQSLKTDGLFFELKDGPLGRYIALNKLYDDPVYGQAAKEFSYGLKIVIILIELAPVLVMVFFSPYSFYAARMRTKKQALEQVLPTLKLKSEIEESHKQEALLREGKLAQRSNKFKDTLDDNFNRAFDDAYFANEDVVVKA